MRILSIALHDDVMLKDFLNGSLAKGTLKTYGSSWRWWSKYLESGGSFDPYLRGYTSVEKSRVLAGIIATVRTKGILSSVSVSILMATLKHYFIVEGVDHSFLEHSVVVKARAASSRMPDKPSSRKVSTGGSRSLVIPPELVIASRPLNWSLSGGTTHLDEVMVYLGVVLAMHFLLRISEYAAADKGNEEHAFRANEVFLKPMGEPAVLIPSFELTARNDQPSIEEVHFRLGSSKTNHKGNGITLSLFRSKGPFEEKLIEDLTWWCRFSGIKSGDIFFRRYYAGKGKSLSRSMISTEVQRLGVSIGLPKEGLSSHSLRVSGACLLHRNGVPVEDIDRIGRWKPGSTTAMAYRAAISITNGSLNYSTNATDPNDVDCAIRDVLIVKQTRNARMK